MNALIDRMLGSTGEERSAWLERQNNALRYYLGPAYEPVNALANVGAMLSPGADMVDMVEAGGELMRSAGPGEAARAGLGLGAAALGMAIPGTAKGISEGVEGAAKGIRAYHGSPHDFDRFDLGKIGTGEGAQAYGHGLYFAESEGVAKSYRDALSQSLPHEAAAAQEFPGHMYEVNINANPDDFLDWDAPLSQQSEKVRNALLGEQGYITDIRGNEHVSEFLAPHVNDDFEGLTGGRLHQMLGRLAEEDYLPANGPGVAEAMDAGAAKRAVAPFLRNEGIPGIKYLDQGSRVDPRQLQDARDELAHFKAQGFGPYEVADAEARVAGLERKAAAASRNYVVFDDKLIDVVRKYGFAGLLAGGAVASQQPEGGL